MRLTDAQWARIEPLSASPPKRPDRRGRPRGSDRARPRSHPLDDPNRCSPGQPSWHFPPRSTCHNRFQEWNRNGTLQRILQVLAEELHQQGELKFSECFIDACFVAAKKEDVFGPLAKRGKGSKLMALADVGGMPLAVLVARASPHETQLVEATLAARSCQGPAGTFDRGSGY